MYIYLFVLLEKNQAVNIPLCANIWNWLIVFYLRFFLPYSEDRLLLARTVFTWIVQCGVTILNNLVIIIIKTVNMDGLISR